MSMLQRCTKKSHETYLDDELEAAQHLVLERGRRVLALDLGLAGLGVGAAVPLAFLDGSRVGAVERDVLADGQPELHAGAGELEAEEARVVRERGFLVEHHALPLLAEERGRLRERRLGQQPALAHEEPHAVVLHLELGDPLLERVEVHPLQIVDTSVLHVGLVERHQRQGARRVPARHDAVRALRPVEVRVHVIDDALGRHVHRPPLPPVEGRELRLGHVAHHDERPHLAVRLREGGQVRGHLLRRQRPARVRAKRPARVLAHVEDVRAHRHVRELALGAVVLREVRRRELAVLARRQLRALRPALQLVPHPPHAHRAHAHAEQRVIPERRRT